MTSQRKIVTSEPENSETPLEAIKSWVTPTRLFFVRNHSQAPAIDLDSWTLTIGGRVARPRTLRWPDIERLPSHTVFATMECAGNGRSFLTQHEHGVQWGAGAVAHAEWSGVPVAALLEEIGLDPAASEVIFEGADSGLESGMTEPTAFARSLPLAKALDGDTLLATHMNGEPLTLTHGFPLRLLAPGWYGVASVKWLTRIEVADKPFCGYYQTTKYTVNRRRGDRVETAIVRAMAVKSEIMSPREGEVLSPGRQRISGIAWAGEDAVAKVEVSLDGGVTWREAALVGPQAPYSWGLWEYQWPDATPGDHIVLARATSSRGEVQPLTHDPLRGGYMITFSRRRSVTVSGTEAAIAAVDPWALLYDMNTFAEANARVRLDVELEYVSDGAGI